MKRKSMVTLLTCTMLSAALLSGCGNTAEPENAAQESAPAAEQAEEESGDAAAESEEASYKIGYVSKMLTNQWFTLENQGLEGACRDLGLEYVAIDANLDDEACDSAINNLIAQEIDALAICITNQGNGPAVAMKCREAGIPLITIDDGFVEGGKPGAARGHADSGSGGTGRSKACGVCQRERLFCGGQCGESAGS